MLIRELFERTIPPQDQNASPEAWLSLTDEAKSYFAQMGYSDWDDRIEVVDAENAIDQGNKEQADDDTMYSIISLVRYLRKK
jgi:hypothetical protein